MKVALASAVGVPGVDERSDDRQGIWWDGEKEGDDVSVAKGFNNRWEKICNGARSNEAEKEDHLVCVSSPISRHDMGM